MSLCKLLLLSFQKFTVMENVVAGHLLRNKYIYFNNYYYLILTVQINILIHDQIHIAIKL